MNQNIKILLIVGIISLVSLNSFAQTDSIKLKAINSEISTTTKSNKLKANTISTKISPNANIDLNINKQLNTNAVNNSLNQYATVKNENFLMETLPEDRDITGKKYFNGQDITHKRLKSTMSLGTVSTTSKVVRVECRDHSYVDGDIIKIFINEQALPNNVALRGSRFTVYLDLKEGYNRIDFQALNQGLSGPNTAELRLFDENDNLISAKEWNLLTSEIATIGVIQK